MNPFKFGSIVDEPYFTNRVEEIKKVRSVLESENHLIISSPRRYGKTSLILKVVKELDRPFIDIDLQIITTPEDLAAQLLNRIYRIYPFEKMKQFIKHFRIIPSIFINPLTNETDVSFRASTSTPVVLEDVLNLLNKLSTVKKRLIVIFDEFQDIKKIGKDLDHYLRSYMQHHKNINYVFLGSQESFIREVFEKKKSPFYHFGFLFPMGKIPRSEFKSYLVSRFKKIPSKQDAVAESILNITHSHPYYTQQLAFTVWEILEKKSSADSPVQSALEELIRYHDIDYERLWNTFNRTDMKIFIGMSFIDKSPLSEDFSRQFDLGATSTVYSSIKKLMQKGYVVRTEKGYEIDDPFFKRWIRERRLR